MIIVTSCFNSRWKITKIYNNYLTEEKTNVMFRLKVKINKISDVQNI